MFCVLEIDWDIQFQSRVRLYGDVSSLKSAFTAFKLSDEGKNICYMGIRDSYGVSVSGFTYEYRQPEEPEPDWESMRKSWDKCTD